MKIAVAILMLLALAGKSSAEDSRCNQLRQLHAQYAGVKLSSSQRAFKAKAAAWYRANCGSRSAAR